MQKIYPNLWFDSEAEEAAAFYTGIFKNSRILSTSHYPAGSPVPEGTVMTVEFELEGQRFVALNAGPVFKFNEAVSFVVDCEDQAEVDEIWGKLSAVPEAEQCGWLKDKYGLSWQIIPKRLTELTASADPATASAAMQAMLKMKKIDLAALEAAVKQ